MSKNMEKFIVCRLCDSRKNRTHQSLMQKSVCAPKLFHIVLISLSILDLCEVSRQTKADFILD